jgi:hypothetical protein
VLVLATAGCVGSIDRDEFQAEVNARGGGLSGDQLVDFVADVEERAGAPGLLIRSASLGHMLVSLEVSDPARPEEVDRWSWSSGNVSGPTPASNLAPEELDLAFTAERLDAVAIEAAIDGALERSAMRDPWASSASFVAQPGDTFVGTVRLTNEREDELWSFGPDGVLVGGES